MKPRKEKPEGGGWHHLSRRKDRDSRSSSEHVVGGKATLTLKRSDEQELTDHSASDQDQGAVEFNVRDPFGGDRDADGDGLDGCAPDADLLDAITLRGGNPEGLESSHFRFVRGGLQLILSDGTADGIRALDNVDQPRPTKP